MEFRLKIVATLIVRDEDDVIYETLDEIKKYTDNIIVLDGGSEDNTVDIVSKFRGVALHKVKSGNNWDHAGERQILLDLALAEGADWIITLDADEIYHTNPIDVIEQAEAEGANLVRCEVPQFFFTEKELAEGTLQTENEALSVQQRRKWYSWGWTECVIFKAVPGVTYLPEKNNGRIRRPPGFTIDPPIEASVRPILKHYQYRSLRQYGKKMKTRRRNCEKNHMRWFRWTYENPFKNEANLAYFDGVFRYDGVLKYKGEHVE